MEEYKYSVLMSVYHKEKPHYLKESILSMLEQSLTPDEIVIVKDGKLTPELESVLGQFKYNKLIKIISLEKNMGLGNALRIGLENCRNEFIARMDTDDISLKYRCEEQIDIFKKNKELSVVGSAIEEFIDTPNQIVAYKKVLTSHEEIVKQMKYRNPMAHPSVMFKKSHVIISGNYQHWLLNEDYYLWIRMMHKGFIFGNVDQPLVKMRINNETYLRRGGWRYFVTQKKLFDYMLENNVINIFDYVFNNVIRFITRVLITNKARKFLYLNILRSDVIKSD